MIKSLKISAHVQKFLVRLKGLIRRKTGQHYRRSFSQCGEDVIARTIFDLLGIAYPTYLDIGAHHPSYMSNTFLFYQNGSRGINVEPDPDLYAKFLDKRKRDLNLNVAVGSMQGHHDLYVMSPRSLNTLSESEAHKYESQGYEIVGKHSVPVVTINQILDDHLRCAPDFLSVDVEGLDFEILSTLDFQRYRPVVICVETITFSKVGEAAKRTEIDSLLSGLGYMRFADTYINSLYVDRAKWVKR